MRQIESSTLSNQDISSALLCHEYTADADRDLLIRLFASQVAGNGVYTAYVTIERLGAGVEYEVQPRTAPTVASGVTSIAFATIVVPVLDTDVVRVYLEGLAGDTTTPDIVTEICEQNYLRPITPDQFDADINASGRVLLQPTQTGVTIPTVTDVTNGVTLTAGALTSVASAVWASGARTLTSFGTLVADIWANGTRTLTSFGTLVADIVDDVVAAVQAAIAGGVAVTFTQTPSEIQAAVQGDRLTIQRDSDWIARIYVTGGISATRNDLLFTVKTAPKKDAAASDSESVIQISENEGLLYLNGADGEAAEGSLTVVDEADDDGNGVIDLRLTAWAASQLAKYADYAWDLKNIEVGEDLARVEGALRVVASVTRTISS
jgi:hypothetical protein